MTYEVEQGTGVYFIRKGAEKSHMISNSGDIEFVWFVQSLNNLQGCCNFFPQRLLTCLSEVNYFLHVIQHIDGRRRCKEDLHLQLLCPDAVPRRPFCSMGPSLVHVRDLTGEENWQHVSVKWQSPHTFNASLLGTRMSQPGNRASSYSKT